jgi:hypothetical protein
VAAHVEATLTPCRTPAHAAGNEFAHAAGPWDQRPSR